MAAFSKAYYYGFSVYTMYTGHSIHGIPKWFTTCAKLLDLTPSFPVYHETNAILAISNIRLKLF